MLCRFDPNKFHIGVDGIVHKEAGWRDDAIQFEKELFVYGIGTISGKCQFLLDPRDEGRPNWYSVEDVTITDSGLPADFSFWSAPESEDWTMLIGYKLLVTSNEHFNGILERERNHLDDFVSVKNYFRKYLSGVLQ